MMRRTLIALVTAVFCLGLSGPLAAAEETPAVETIPAGVFDVVTTQRLVDGDDPGYFLDPSDGTVSARLKGELQAGSIRTTGKTVLGVHAEDPVAPEVGELWLRQ